MSGLPRPTPAPLIRALAQRLAEDYDAVPLREVSQVVQDAAAAATGPDGTFTGTNAGLPTLIDTIERVARDDLDAIIAAPTGTQRRALRKRPLEGV
jgi:hypothetical protein